MGVYTEAPVKVEYESHVDGRRDPAQPAAYVKIAVTPLLPAEPYPI